MQNDESYQERIHSTEQEIAVKKAEEQKYIEEKEKIDVKISQTDDLLSSTLVALEQIRDNIKKYTKEIEECSNATFEYLNQNSVIKSNIQRYETMLEQNAIRKAQLNQKILKSKSEEGLFDEEISRYRDQLSYISEEISRFTNESESLNKSVNDSQNKIDNITYRLNELQRQYHIEKSRHESLVNLTERYEGYGNSIKR